MTAPQTAPHRPGLDQLPPTRTERTEPRAPASGLLSLYSASLSNDRELRHSSRVLQSADGSQDVPGSPAQAFRLSLALLLAVVVVTIHAGMQLRGSKDGRRVYAIQSSESKMGIPGYASS